LKKKKIFQQPTAQYSPEETAQELKENGKVLAKI
jgi:hypothetical protein